MQSEAKTVDVYLEEIPEVRREALTRLRMLCQEVLEGYEETMDYGMPGFKQADGEIEVAFASQKNYISLYILKNAVLNKYRDELSHLSVGKGCIRFRRPEQIDFDLVENMLRESIDSDSEVC